MTQLQIIKYIDASMSNICKDVDINVADFKEIYNNMIPIINDAKKDGEVDIQTIIAITPQVVKLTQNLSKINLKKIKTKLDGPYKKKLVQAVLRLLMENLGIKNPFGIDNQEHVGFIINTIIPDVIENIVSVAKGDLTIEKGLARQGRRCVSYCFGDKVNH